MEREWLADRWLTRALDRGAGVDLLCLPRAGFGLNQFGRWPRAAGGYEIRALRFPGDHDPLWWPAHASFAAQAADLVDDLEVSLSGRFALFGHGSSALVAYEVAAELDRRGMAAPARLIVSGSEPPQHACARGPLPPDDLLEEEALMACLEIGGNPLPSLVELAVCALRAEALARQAYAVTEPARLGCPITALSWSHDVSAGPAAMAGWSQCGATTFATLEGSRYRYAQAPAELLAAIPAPGPE